MMRSEQCPLCFGGLEVREVDLYPEVAAGANLFMHAEQRAVEFLKLTAAKLDPPFGAFPAFGEPACKERTEKAASAESA
jgi:hypothetical protein